MAKNEDREYSDGRSEGHVDTPQANFQCENEDENLGFVVDDGVTFQEFTSEQGELTPHGVCGSRPAKRKEDTP
jgi:hypothetical protein